MAYGSRDYIFAINLWTFRQWFIIHKDDHISYHLQAEAYFVHWSIFGHHKSKWNPLLHVKALVADASPPSTIHAASVTHRGCLGREGEVPPAKSSAINNPCWWIPSRELRYPTWRIRKSSSKSALLGDIFFPRGYSIFGCGSNQAFGVERQAASSLFTQLLRRPAPSPTSRTRSVNARCKYHLTTQHAAARCAHLDAPTQQSQQGEEGPTRFDDPGHMASLHHVTHFTQKRFTIFLQDAALQHSSKGKQKSQDNSNSQPVALQNMGKATATILWPSWRARYLWSDPIPHRRNSRSTNCANWHEGSIGLEAKAKTPWKLIFHGISVW